MKKTSLFKGTPLAIMVFTIVALSCSPLANFLPTPTPTHTATTTVTKTPTVTATPTNTLTPTSTDTPTPTITPTIRVVLGARWYVDQGGFSFKAPQFPSFQTEISGSTATMVSTDDNIIIGLISSELPSDLEGLADVKDLLSGFLIGMEDSFEVFDAKKPEMVTIGGIDGWAADFSGIDEAGHFTGSVAFVATAPRRVFMAIGTGFSAEAKDYWLAQGEKVYTEVVATVEFLDIVETSGTNASSKCVVSTDNTYAYTKDNPVKVGGGSFDGPSRERAYLNNLRGPKGEVISYERRGSLPHDDTILDIYDITYAGSSGTITIYIDEYIFSELMAPIGFTCAGPFPLGAP